VPEPDGTILEKKEKEHGIMAAGDTLITLVGTLVDDLELRFTPNG
jgi:hypothetical protein